MIEMLKLVDKNFAAKTYISGIVIQKVISLISKTICVISSGSNLMMFKKVILNIQIKSFHYMNIV